MIRAAALLAVALLSIGCAGGDKDQAIARYLVYTKGIGLPQQAVWIGDVDGRNMRRLAQGRYGLVSPDGTRIALSRASGVYTTTPEGADEAFVSRGRAADWFPDSRHLLIFRRDGLVSMDLEDQNATVLVRKSALLRGWSISPDGDRLAYAVATREAPWGICREELDIFLIDRDGGSRRRLTRGGRSSDPVWGEERILFARHPVDRKCITPKAGIWTMPSAGGDARPIVRRAPRRFAWNGYYGLRPYTFVRGRPLIVAGILTEWGDELALVDSRTGRVRRPDLDRSPRYAAPMYVESPSLDGRHVVGAACGAEFPCTIQIFSVLEERARDLVTGRVGSPHWNR